MATADSRSSKYRRAIKNNPSRKSIHKWLLMFYHMLFIVQSLSKYKRGFAFYYNSHKI